MSRSGMGYGWSVFPARANNRGTARAAGWQAGSAPGCTGQGRGREPGSRCGRCGACVLAARVPLLRDAAARAGQRTGGRRVGQHLGGARRGGPGARHYRW
jgi:hypothetical protein